MWESSVERLWKCKVFVLCAVTRSRREALALFSGLSMSRCKWPLSLSQERCLKEE